MSNNWIGNDEINELLTMEINRDIEVVEVPVDCGIAYTQEHVNKLFKGFLSNLEKKNSWGKNELKVMFLETMLGIYNAD